MNNKIRITLSVIALWFVLFLILDWWNSYPKVKINPTVKTDSFQDKIDSLLQHSLREYTLAGIGVGIVKEGKIIYQNAFGFQNLELLDSFTVHTPLPVASISKIFTALATAHFLSALEIDVDQPISELNIQDSSVSDLEQLTFSDFLEHKTGFRNPGLLQKLISPDVEKPLSEYGHLTWMEEHVLPDSPSYVYQDGNFDMLGYFLQESSGLPFETYLRQNILQPAGMANSFFTTKWPIDSFSSSGYQETFVWRRMEHRPITFERLPSPSSGLISSVEDLSLLIIHLLRGEMGIFQKELNWLTPGKGQAPLGFQSIMLHEAEWYGHYGGQAGYSSLLVYSPSQNQGLILLANSRDSKNFRKEIMEKLLEILSNYSPQT